MAVDGFGDFAARVANQPGDLLDSYLAIGQQADECVPQLPRGPVSSDTGCAADRSELTPDVAGIQRASSSRTETLEG
jgi:hypothetical protein